MDPFRRSDGQSALEQVKLEPIIVRQIISEIRHRGMEAQFSYAGLGFGPQDLMEPAFIVSGVQTRQIVHRAMVLLGDRHLGLQLGANANLAAWGDCLLGLMVSPNSGEMLRFLTLWFPPTGKLLFLQCDERTEGTWLVARPLCNEDAGFNDFLVEKAFACLVQAVRTIVSPEYRPLRVELAMPHPVGWSPHAKVLGCPVHFAAAEHRMLFPKATSPIRTGDPVVLERIRRRLHSEGQTDDAAPSLDAAVARLVRVRLDDPPTLLEVASTMHMSARTLNRRLSESGISYTALLDRERRIRVTALLHGCRLSLPEVAAAVGFADVRSLRRAVKRWSGVSPSTLRAGNGADRVLTTRRPICRRTGPRPRAQSVTPPGGIEPLQGVERGDLNSPYPREIDET